MCYVKVKNPLDAASIGAWSSNLAALETGSPIDTETGEVISGSEKRLRIVLAESKELALGVESDRAAPAAGTTNRQFFWTDLKDADCLLIPNKQPRWWLVRVT